MHSFDQSSITVGVPVYNAMPYLPEAIESLLAQTVDNFEILAVIDGANDGSLQYLESLKEPRLHLHAQPHSGLTSTLNTMLQKAETAWLIRQDADDVSYPTRIERLQEEIARHQDAGMFYSLAEYYPRERSLGRYRCSQGSPQELRKIVRSGYLLSICHPSVALNVEKTLALGGYRQLQHAEDADLWWRMALQYDIRFLPEVLVGFRQNNSSVSTKHSYLQEVHGLYIQYLLLSHLLDLPALPLSDIAPLLEEAISTDYFEAKQQLRNLNMHLAAKHYSNAATAFLRAALASPGYLLRRLMDEFFPSRLIANGIAPSLFHQRKEIFWP
jgi:glycosyltransferase involved in cell wall biosynthesis